MKIFRLRKGLDRRFLAGHPWVYSNEIQGSPKEVEPGGPVEIQGPQGEFLALGYGNPHSLIFFRALSRSPQDCEKSLEQLVFERMASALEFRQKLGIHENSFRWSHGEGDGLPGLVLDLYQEISGKKVVVAQFHTAGMDRLRDAVMTSVRRLVGDEVALILRNDLGVRTLEGLQNEAPQVIQNPSKIDLEKATIRVRGGLTEPVSFDVNLLQGQKTGFFMDQTENITQVERILEGLIRGKALPRKVRMLDLCCYVGQWSTRISTFLRAQGHEVECTLVDASSDALALAERNVQRAGGQAVRLKADVLRDLPQLEEPFDLVISDPPALIQGRKNIPQGTHAYLQLHTQAIRLTRAGGTLVSCSCSQLLDEEEMIRTLTKASHRNHQGLRYVARGTQAWDHPIRLEFPEGRYLKMWVGIVESGVKS